MHTSIGRSALAYIALILIGVVDNNAYAGMLRFSFAGVFSECFPEACEDSPLTNLVNKPFSGVIEVPDASSSAEPEVTLETNPYLAEKGLYPLDSRSSIVIKTGEGTFDIEEMGSVHLEVYNCNEPACPLFADNVQLFVINGDYGYSLKLFAPNPPFETIEVPSLSKLRSLSARLDISKLDASESISSANSETPMTLKITAFSNSDEDSDATVSLPAILSHLLDTPSK